MREEQYLIGASNMIGQLAPGVELVMSRVLP